MYMYVDIRTLAFGFVLSSRLSRLMNMNESYINRFMFAAERA